MACSQSKPETPAAEKRLLRVLLPLLALFIAGVFLYTRHNDFPVGFHPDERSKAAQVIGEEDFNFNHPLALLIAARVVGWTTGQLDSITAATRAGRLTTALFTALAVVALAFMAWRTRGAQVAVMTGALALVATPLIVYSHYFKEDPALLFGLGLTLACLAAYEKRPSPAGLIAMGVAGGALVSAKYVGVIIAAVIACAWRLLSPRNHQDKDGEGKTRTLLLLLAPALLVVAALNYPILLHPGRFLQSLLKETGHALVAHDGLQFYWLRFPYVRWFIQGVSWPVAMGAVAGAVFIFRDRKEILRAELIVLFIAIALLAILSFGRLYFFRYLLPVIYLSHYFCAVGVVRLWEQARVSPRWRRAGVWVCALALFAFLALRGWGRLEQFRDESRHKLRQWALEHLSPGDRVAQELYAALPKVLIRDGAGGREEIGIGRIYCAGDLVSLDQARQQGITHVIVCSTVYDWYFNPDIHPHHAEGERYLYESRKRFYKNLFSQAKLLWRSDRPDNIICSYLNPEIRVYRLTSPAPSNH